MFSTFTETSDVIKKEKEYITESQFKALYKRARQDSKFTAMKIVLEEERKQQTNNIQWLIKILCIGFVITLVFVFVVTLIAFIF